MYEKQRDTQQDSQQGPTEKQGQIKLGAFQGETGEHSVLLGGKLSGSCQKTAMKRKDEASVADQYFRWNWIFFEFRVLSICKSATLNLQMSHFGDQDGQTKDEPSSSDG